MIILSADFQARVAANDTRKLTAAHLFYDETNYLPVASVATLIGGEQYYGILKDMNNASHKWNITGNNTVTVNTPRVTLVDYNTPDNFSIVREFNTRTFYGRKIVIYYGYEGQILSDMLKAFEGIIEDVNYDGNEIEITCKNHTLPEVNISGRKINYDEQKIGDTSVPAGFKIHKENHNKVIPVPFGNQWNAVMVPSFYSPATREINFCIYDEEYSSLLSKGNLIRTDIYQYNIGIQSSLVMMLNDEAFTPVHLQGWSGVNEITYTPRFNSATYLNGITLTGMDAGNHSKSDDKYFVTVPLKYQVRDDLTNWFNIQYATSDTPSTIKKVFDNSNYTTPFTIINSNPGVTNAKLSVKLSLDMQKNLRADEKSFVRRGRKISIPETQSNNGQGYLLGKYLMNAGTLGWFHDNVWVTVDEFPIHINHWKENYIPDTLPSPQSETDKRFIGAGDLGRLTPTTTRTFPYSASFGARVFNKDTAFNFNFDVFKEDNYLIGAQGSNGGINYTGADASYGLDADAGNDPFINRAALKVPVGAILNVYPSGFKNYNSTGFGDNTIKLYKAFHLTAGEIDLKTDDRMYAASNGVSLTSSNSLLSTPQNANTYKMVRPYEYLEFLLKDKTQNSNFSADFNYTNINTKWNSFFSTARDGSGFVIEDEVNLDKFVNEYIKEEPFTLYSAEDGSYQFKMLKKIYVTGDTQGTLDYNDATDFDINLSPSENIRAEIKSLKTDYMYDIDDFVLDINWRLKTPAYNYSFWKFNNSIDNNEFKIDAIEKKFTSYVTVATVTYGGKYWGCSRTNINQIPSAGSLYWTELNEPVSSPAWSSSTKYFGEDAEQYEIASWYLNQWANRHRMVEFKTDRLEYLKYNVGDVIEFSNVPFTLVGMDIKGFNGATNFTSTVNGQTVYASFIITAISKNLKTVSITAMQLHDLTAYNIERIN